MISKLIVYIVLLLKKYIKIQHYLVYHDKTKVLNISVFFKREGISLKKKTLFSYGCRLVIKNLIYAFLNF